MSKKYGSGALVLALIASTAIGCAPTPAKAVDPHVLPNSLVNVSLENFDKVSYLDVDLHTAIQTREAVEAEFEKTYGKQGHPRWFFHAFDVANLDFVVARYEPTSRQGIRYVAERRLRVRRSRDAERALGISDVVLGYEASVRVVKPGMSKHDLVVMKGKPDSEKALGRPGSFEMRYPAFCARFLDNKVAHVWRREQCGP